MTITTVHLWKVPRHAVPQALWRLGVDRPALARLPFAKLLGTGSGETFDPRDSTLDRWVLLACHPDIAAAEAFEVSRPVRHWDALAGERARLLLEPVASRGRWSGREPFGRPVPRPVTGRVVAVTRARIRPARLATFWRAVPPVSTDLQHRPGLLLRLGIGEAPVGLQGTLSLWRSEADLTDFAYVGAAHRQVVADTPRVGWYAEELFARFAVLDLDGSTGGRPLADLG